MVLAVAEHTHDHGMNPATALSALLSSIEAYEDLQFDPSLLAELALLQPGPISRPPIHFYTPSFKQFDSGELCSSRGDKWPAVSISGGECKLQCDHCKAGILKPMHAATTPTELERLVTAMIDKGAEGMLLTGGSNHRNEVEYAPFLAVIERLKTRHPAFTIAAHTALVTPAQARALEGAGIDVAMLDIIGAQDTITQVYHLKRPVEDFEHSLAALCSTSMRVVPHIVMGLHYGHLLGEWQALEMVSRHAVDALVLVAVMPQYATAQRPFAVPQPEAIGALLMQARARLPATPMVLGCARPAGPSKQLIDAYAVMAGINGIAHPSAGAVALAQGLGRPYEVFNSCCSINHADTLLALGLHTPPRKEQRLQQQAIPLSHIAR